MRVTSKTPPLSVTPQPKHLTSSFFGFIIFLTRLIMHTQWRLDYVIIYPFFRAASRNWSYIDGGHLPK